MVSSEARANLRASGLTDATIESAGIEDTPAQVGEGPAYKIPYFDINGNPMESFHRTRFLGPEARIRYKQPPRTDNHAYIPPNLPENWERDTSQVLVITEGEKKALKASQEGLICVGIGGVDLWRTRKFVIPTESIVARPTEKRKTTLVSMTDSEARLLEEEVVPELLQIKWQDRPVIIAFDHPDVYTNDNVARAAFALSAWLWEHGAEPTLWSPAELPPGKVGIDDYLIKYGVDDSFDPTTCVPPTPPNPQEWVRHMLNQRQSRAIQTTVARGVLSILDNNGKRYRSSGARAYYFEYDNKTLHTFNWDDKEKLRSKSFGRILNNIGLQGNDAGARDRLADEYMNRDPIQEVVPYNTIATRDHAIYYQITNGRMCKVTAEGLDFLDNGDDGVLFSSVESEALDEDLLVEEATKVVEQWDDVPLKWYDTFQSVWLQPQPPYDLEQTRVLLTCLYYLSPWVQRWRGLQLPIELAIAEPGSGKTFLFNLRKKVLTGRAKLDQVPTEFKDWMAQLEAAPGLWVGDNLGGNTDRTFWNQMNETLARIVTDPEPMIDTRELYTTSDLKHIHVRCAFAFTAIGNFFNAADVLQRSIVYKLQAIPEGEKDSNWYDRQLRPGREAWVAEHLIVLHKFLESAERDWDEDYKSGHRLRHFEQALLIMGRTLNLPIEPIIEGLSGMVNEEIAMDNPLADALRDYIDEMDLFAGRKVSLSDITTWAADSEAHRNFPTFRSSKMLGKRIREQKSQLEKSLGIVVIEYGRQLFIKLPPKHEEEGDGEDEA